MSGILLVGMNHRTAPVEIRERLSLACRQEPQSPVLSLKAIPAVSEALYLGTCNRVEVLACSDDPAAAEAGLTSFVLGRGNLPAAELARCLYAYRDLAAVRHLFRVAASLDSLVIGEPQILGQLKDAYREAVEEGATGVILNKVLHHAFRVAKRVRTETGIAGHAVSVSFAAVELARKIFGTLAGRRVMLIGAAEMSELAARHLASHGAASILIANRTRERAIRLAQELNGEAVTFESLTERLDEVDIVISATGAPGYVITPEMVRAALHRRKNRLLFLIDVAVPRDIDPRTAEIDNVYLYDIDDLQEIADENKALRRGEAEKAAAIVEEELRRHEEWFNTLAVVPTIVSLKEKTQEIVRGELERSSGWLQGLDEQERRRVEILAASIVNKILHAPFTCLKEESQNHGGLAYVAALRRLFRLDEP